MRAQIGIPEGVGSVKGVGAGRMLSVSLRERAWSAGAAVVGLGLSHQGWAKWSGLLGAEAFLRRPGWAGVVRSGHDSTGSSS